MRWTEEGPEYEADPRHRQKIMKIAGFSDASKRAVSAALKIREPEEGDQEPET